MSGAGELENQWHGSRVHSKLPILLLQFVNSVLGRKRVTLEVDPCDTELEGLARATYGSPTATHFSLNM
jgi:hypothetical protein